MKAISIRSDLATRIGRDEKIIEVRTWQTKHRGELLICANRERVPGTMPGCAICVVNLKIVRPMIVADCAAACLRKKYFQAGLYAWEIERLYDVYPFKVRGKPGIFDVPDENIRKVDDENMTDDEWNKMISEEFMPFVV